jgi:hypothetical protein
MNIIPSKCRNMPFEHVTPSTDSVLAELQSQTAHASLELLSSRLSETFRPSATWFDKRQESRLATLPQTATKFVPCN